VSRDNFLLPLERVGVNGCSPKVSIHETGTILENLDAPLYFLEEPMRKPLVLIIVLTLALATVGIANAASEAEKQAAIQSGLSWLASQQQAGGYWNYGGNERAATAAALLAFSEQKLKPGGWFGADYTSVVNNAANYLLQQTKLFTFPGANWWGFSGTGSGLEWYGGDRNRSTYETGLTIPALSRYAASLPGLGVNTVIAGTGNVNVDGKTYAQVIQLGVDSFIWGQRGPANGVYHGGWRYHPQWTDADNSTAQWPPIAMLYAQALAGTTVPAQTPSALINWINYIQNPVSGGSGYTRPDGLDGIPVNEAKTGGLLLEIVFAGGGGNMTAAINYLNNNWLNTANSTWDGNFGHPYAMWSIYKGLESTIGLDDMTTITNLHADPGDIDNPDHGWNWWEDYCNSLVNSQNADGSWGGYSNWTGPLATAWNINILNATAVPPPVIPIPGSVGLLGTGLLSLLGAGWWRRRKA